MSDGRLTVVTAGDVYPSVDGARLFLESSGYDMVAHAGTSEDLVAAVTGRPPDAVVVGDELAGQETLRALRRASPDCRIVVVSSHPAPPADAPDRADAYVGRGAPLAAIAAALAGLLVTPSATAIAPVGAPAPAPRGLERFRALQFVAAAALALSLGGLIFVFSGGTRPLGGLRAAPGGSSPPVVSPGSPTPGSTSTASPASGAAALRSAQAQLGQMVQAIQSQRYDEAVSLARGLISDRQQVVQSGLPADALDAQITSSLQPLVPQLPAEVVPVLRSVLDGLLPSPGSIRLTGAGTFGEVQVGATSQPRGVLVNNASDQVLTLSGIQIEGDGASHFTQSNDCSGTSLSPGGTCTVEIAFSPTTPGAKAARLLVQAQGVSPATLDLAGTGVSAPAADTQAPIVLCAQPGAGWHGTDLVVGCSARDEGSGLVSASDASFTLSTHVPAGTEDGNAFTGVKTVCDKAGNCTVAGPIGGIRIDKRAPEVICAKPDHSWQGANVEVRCRSRDRGSGLASVSEAGFSLATSVRRGVEDADASTGSRRVCDAVGNCTVAGPIGGLRVDRKAPRTACEHADGAWHARDATVTCSATDGGSGVQPRADGSFTLSTNVPAGTADTNAKTGVRRVCDAVGNCTTAGPVGGFKIDKAAPRIALSGIGDGSIFLLNRSVSALATVKCTDQGSGVASCSAPSTVDTGEVGTFSFTATATDEVGNSSTASVTYQVTYGVDVLFDPSRPTRKISIRLVDAGGVNVSAASISVTAVDIDGASLHKSFVFSRSIAGYVLTIPGRKDSTRHVLHFQAEGDPVMHSVSYVMDDD